LFSVSSRLDGGDKVVTRNRFCLARSKILLGIIKTGKKCLALDGTKNLFEQAIFLPGNLC
jgi:hypothetical protein